MTIAPTVVWNAGYAHGATTVLTEAFLDDEGLVHFVPDARRRSRMLSTVVAEVVAAAAAHDSLLCAVNADFGIVGVAAVHRPNSALWRARSLRSALALARDAARLFVHSPRTTVAAGLRWVALWRLRARLPRHHHLAMIGVLGHQRGLGLGTLLLGEVLRRGDEAGVGCALETNSSDTRDWYARHGFRSRAALRWAGRTTWLMYRPPPPTKDPS
jgi:ribosomal protein S18 acetylase RimI-like enzyme